VIAWLVLLQPCLLCANVQLPSIISDHMVLERSAAVPLWGKAGANEEVTVTLAGRTAHAKAGGDGRWLVRLDLHDCGPGPFQLLVQGKSTIRVSDVAVGTVWLASGQSNMEFPLKGSAGAEEEIARSGNPQFRQFRAEKAARPQPADDGKGKWVLAGPETAGDFTAVGYYFGKRLHEELKLPVGIVNASWGGTFSEAWTSIEAINRVESFRKAEAGRWAIAAEYPGKKKAFVSELAAWLRANQREDRPAAKAERYAGESVSTAGWTAVSLPGKIAGAGLPASGAVWIRRTVSVPAAAIVHGLDFKVLLGQIAGFERVYWNGQMVHETPYQKYPGQGYACYFPVPPQLVRVGDNTIAVRIYAPSAEPNIATAPTRFWAGPISLTGQWLAKAEYEFPPLVPQVLAAAPHAPARPPDLMAGAIFNGVIHSILPYGIAGVVWYQGESNAGRAYEYRIAFPLLIDDWRQQWQQPQLPFYFCQLPCYGPKRPLPAESEWAELRESQSVASQLPNTGQAVLIDLGESEDQHPRNKKDVGERLARLVLAKQFGKPVIFSGPVYESFAVEGQAIRVKFSHTDGGLVAKALNATYDVVSRLGKTAPLLRNSPTSQLEGFSICGDDHRWVWAEAKIDAGSVVVWSDRIPHPVAVRYAWADNPTCNLANAAGLPAAPFRTDDFPAMTAKNHFGIGN
jgi:sialate O-acetylesterase